MEHSICVYIVTRRGRPLAGFTVRQELITWVANHPGHYKIWLCSNNPSYDNRVPYEVTNEIKEIAEVRDVSGM